MGSNDEQSDIDRLYEFGERLNEAKDKSTHVSDYKGIIEAAKGSQKAKQLAAQLIPRFYKYFPSLATEAMNAHFDLCEEEELGIRVQAIRALPLFGKDSSEYVAKIVDVLGQLLVAEENLERDAVQKSILSLLRQDTKETLTALFKHIEGSDENVREKVLAFVRDKVFPLKSELLKPQEQMERHVTDLVKKCLQDVTGAEFKMFMDFLKSLNIFGEKAPPERVQELIEIIEGQADLDAQFNVSDNDHIDRLMSCLYMALPFYMRGASNSKFLIYLNKHILPVFDKLPEERKQDLLKSVAEASPYTTPQDARHLLPSVLNLLKTYMPRRKTGEEMNFTYVECLLYTFHHLAHKTPNSTNSLCGYKIVTGQPSDRLGEDFSDINKDFMERLSNIEDLAKATIKKLTQGMAEHNKAVASAKTEEAKAAIPLHLKAPTFIGDKKINLSWKEAVKAQPAAPAGGGVSGVAGNKRSATAIATNGATGKKGRGSGGAPNQLVNVALAGISRGGRGGRGGGYWGGRGRGRGFR
ncbi:Apoptosis inhibitor 5 [Nymphaea thermarum]|nr:Apoptosis inhibitor 5 [Nymphaea thermarum]